RSVFNVEAGDRYWLENVKEKLGEPGEFYVDPEQRAVYFIPPSEDPIQRNELPIPAWRIIVPSLMQVMRLEGDPANGKFVHDVIFQGITFAHSEWGFERLAASKEPITGYHQAAIGVPGAIWGEGVRSCTFDHCTIADVGSYGIELARGCQHNRITHCDIRHTGAGGIKIGETMVRASEEDQTSHNEISDCTIADGGNLFPSCVAVWIGQSHDNTIAHNDIHGFWYTAISMGWTWGYGKSAAQRNMVEYNHIHHIGIRSDDDQPILSDMGGIYTLGNQEGGMIRFNKFHDIAAIKYGGWGIYFDEGTTHLTAEKNLVYRTTHGGFHQHYGKENIVRNNIFAFGRDAQIQRTRVEEHTSFTFERNIVDWDHGNLFAGNWSKEKAVFDYNTYWNGGAAPIRFGKKSWEQWRAAGMDEHSKIADPKFADPVHGHFTLTNPDALPEGFQNFDLSGIGPRQG
ncbi:MAG TPA: right-handed parallel beta-helix repeat-containing protein, partial [Bryobacteraceae bacterium]|nr:right-handed parallel beta-helix repeat-containing protein [Bryobacteraceae bacterium]